MIWVVKVTETAGQIRITLPKSFCELYKIDMADYLVIDDRDPKNIRIGGLWNGSNKTRNREDDRNGID